MKKNARYGLCCLIMILMLCGISGCEKYLQEKPDVKLATPSRIADLQALLDNRTTLNEREPTAVLTVADGYSLSQQNYMALEESDRNKYTWAPANQFTPGGNNDWVLVYGQVYTANVVLDYLPELISINISQTNDVKGQALLIRSKAFLQAMTIWAMPYHPSTSTTELGVPLRLNTNFNIPSVRASVEQCYQQIIKDLKESASLLPAVSVHPLRPSKPAAYGFLARAFLAMGKADSCLKYSDLALGYKNVLLDYNGDSGINAAAQYPFARFNAEVVYDTYMGHPLSISSGIIDPALYASYQDNDLRKQLFFRGAGIIGYFKGSYEGTFNLFNGIATDELWLMKAESSARIGKVAEAVTAINTLLIKRYRTGTYMPLVTSDADIALDFILKERRKQLVFRGLRWMDMRRFGVEGKGQLTKRTVNDREYVLTQRDRAFALAIPEDIILVSGMQQNMR
ncbi:RagB/SusD family nutrient uptake outer membrane protein [Pedobacter sp. UBA4863]|uniref:RagB/SusD family nutrient uptake outer membrane protein n=1 Tax=Pedobacter sp. UBA4863 TaxID=1947060 RepID=UPI0025CCB5E2|nr:RagB/SusD family nutrient uptake outer membrane protein [Pedobacter sp. UBA4863]